MRGDPRTKFLNIVPGMKPVDPADLAEYERAMREEAIPKMLAEVEERRRLAAESRWRWLEMPTGREPRAE